MRDCIYTKINGACSTDDLHVFGHIRVNVIRDTTITASQRIIISLSNSSPDTFTVKSNGGNYLALTEADLETNPVSSITVPAGSQNYTIYVKNASYTIDVSGRYADFTSFAIYGKTLSVGLDELQYCNIQNIVAGNSSRGSIECFSAKTGISTISANSKDVYGDISALGNLSSITSLDLNNAHVTGNIEVLGKLTSCTKFAFVNSLIQGTVESLVAAQRDNGRTTCSGLTLNINGTSVTFNGATVSALDSILSWTSSTITYNGVTINA